MAWLLLVVAGLLEVGWAIGLKYTEGFTRPWPTVGTVTAMVLSVGLLGVAMKSLPVGTAYAVWVGVGAVGTAALGIVFTDPDARTFYRDWHEVAADAVAGFRLNHGHDPGHPRVQEVLTDMLATSPAFAELWQTHRVRGKSLQRKRFHHPEVGDLELEALALADVGDAAEAEAGQCTEHRLALRVEDLGLGHDVDDDSGHGALLGEGWPAGPMLPRF